jgi:hypothetical protein
MSDRTEPIFDTSEQAILNEIGQRLRAEGWAEHVTVERLLRNWHRLSVSVDRYIMTVDDYTNDLTARDGLEIVLTKCPERLGTKLRAHIELADQEFLARTLDDVEHTLGHYFRIDRRSGWWWHRKPTAGPLAEYLSISPYA